ncbi:MAG: helix-turn-helix domain-containing protein [Bacteroidales bacterium]|nr:helix-turn-helix domain-containing protein [Bacteroidales bacterium]
MWFPVCGKRWMTMARHWMATTRISKRATSSSTHAPLSARSATAGSTRPTATGKSGLGREGYRKPKDQKAEEYKETLKLLRKGYPYRKVAKLCGVSESTVKRLKKEFEI